MLTGTLLPMPEPIAKARGTDGVGGLLRALGRIVWRTIMACFHYRVTGLAAETAFFSVLSLPPLIFGLAGAIGAVATQFPVTSVSTFRRQILHYAGRFLTPDTVNQIIAPTLDEVLGTPRLDIISIGFVIALWSGSRALAVFVDTITIMYGRAGERGVLRTRALSFGLYLAFLIGGTLVLPLVVAGPRLVDSLLPAQLDWLGELYWPVVLVGSVLVLTTLYNLSIPVRSRWRADIPGAVLTLVLWLVGSWLLRLALIKAVGTTSIYGPLATPIALLAWLYLMAIAVLIGAALNASVAKVAPRVAGLSRAQAEDVLAREAVDD